MTVDPRPLNMLVLLTRACPLACRYCAMDRRPGAMRPEVLRRAADLILEEEGPVELQYFGGEPLLEYDLLISGVDYAARQARRRGKSLRQVVTTCGLLLTPSRARELAGKGCSFILSLDGDRAVSARQRPLAKAGTYPWELLRRNLRGLLSAGADFFVNLVVTPASVGRLASSTASLLKEGVRRLQFSYALGVGWGCEGAAALEESLARADALCAERGVDVLNRRGGPEPVLLDGQIVLDVDGTLSVGCWTVLETVFPGLREAFGRGPVSEARRLPVLERSAQEQLRRLLAAARTPAERGLMLDNVALGRRVARFWTRRGAEIRA